MGITVPTHVPTTFDFWDNEESSWVERFLTARRPSQRTGYFDGTFAVENGSRTELLRLYADVVGHADFDAAKAVQNATEFKHGGAINVAIAKGNRIGLVWNYRPIVPPEKTLTYREAWKRLAHVPSKKKRRAFVERFLTEVMPLIGAWSLELARGYGSPTKTAEQTGKSEAEEELLVRCLRVTPLGLLGEDTAQNPALNDYFLAEMDVKGKPSNPADLWEKIAARAEWATRTELDQAVRNGYILDPYTLAGMEMLRIYQPETYAGLAK